MYPWLIPYYQQFIQQKVLDRLPHALMLIGDNGIGITALTDAIAKDYLCHSPVSHQACGFCHSCRLFEQDSHPDFMQKGLEEKSIGVESIRDCTDRIARTPQLGIGKVIVIQHAEKMTESASNALLKTLEEPAGKTLILMTVPSASRLLPTIRSRCQQWVIHPDPKISFQWLTDTIQNTREAEKCLRLYPLQPLAALSYYQEQGWKALDAFWGQLEKAIEQPWFIPEFSKQVAAEWSEKQSLLLRMMTEVAKVQQGIPIADSVFPDQSKLISLLASFAPEKIFDAIGALFAMKANAGDMPSSTPSLLMTEWMVRFLTKE